MCRTWGWVLASAVASIGCGRFGFDPTAGDDAAGAGASDGAPTDATSDAAAGDAAPLGPFAPPVPVDELNTGSDELGPSLSADGTELYFTSNRGGSYTLYRATRAGATGPFEAIEPVSELDLGGVEYDADLSRDARELVFVSSDGPAGLRFTARDAATDPWDTPAEVVAGGGGREGPSLMLGDTRMMLSTDSGIEEWARAGVGDPWQLLREHASLAGMAWPGVREDGLEVYGQLESTGAMYVATRATVDDAFGTPDELTFAGGPVPGDYFADVELSADGRTMYLSIQVGSDFDMYATTR